MICYQVANTVGTSIRSLISQSYTNWECLVVDDGSTDDMTQVLSQFNDSRIRYFRTEKNQGRGHASARALAEAGGKFLCALDPDDWMFFSKLESQVNFLEAHPEVSMVGMQLALVSDQHKLLGVMGQGDNLVKQMSNFQVSNPALVGSMVRTEIARKIGFDPKFRRSQDFDFFHRYLQDRKYAVLPEIGYAYYVDKGHTAEVVLEGLNYNIHSYGKTLWRHPVPSLLGMASCFAKIVIYAILNQLSLWSVFTDWRRKLPTVTERQVFAQALDALGAENDESSYATRQSD